MKLEEKKRSELLNQSRSADKTKSYGTTRYDRRNAVSVFNTARSFDLVDMNSFFKANVLSFRLPVHGESGNYEVEIVFKGVCDDIRNEIKLNKYVIEYKCIYRALIKAINNQDIYIGCTCKDFKFRFNYWSTKDRYGSMKPQLVPANVTNPNNSKGAGCKHLMNVLANLD